MKKFKKFLLLTSSIGSIEELQIIILDSAPQILSTTPGLVSPTIVLAKTCNISI